MKQADKPRNTFGQLTRFWRSTLELSQAQLAERVETAPRHISFLETGRSKPTREMVLRLSSALELGQRDTDTLLMASGLVASPSQLDLNAPENAQLRRTVGMLLEKHEPYPAQIINNMGDVVMCNKAWLSMMDFAGIQQVIGPRDPAQQTNLYHLYFSEDGLKQGIRNWEELACFILLKVKEQQFISADSKLEELSEWLQAYPGLPTDWARRAKNTKSTSTYDIKYQSATHKFHSRTLITSIEANYNESNSQLKLHSCFPQNDDTKALWEGLNLSGYTGHPLIY